jgi:hypothetical protein
MSAVKMSAGEIISAIAGGLVLLAFVAFLVGGFWYNYGRPAAKGAKKLANRAIMRAASFGTRGMHA